MLGPFFWGVFDHLGDGMTSTASHTDPGLPRKRFGVAHQSPAPLDGIRMDRGHLRVVNDEREVTHQIRLAVR